MGKTAIIIRREFNERVRKKSFIVSTLLTPLLFLALMAGIIAMTTVRTGKAKIIEVIDHSGLVVQNLVSGSELQYIPTNKTVEEINASRGATWGVLVIGADIVDNPSDVQLYTYSSSTLYTESAISSQLSTIIEQEKLKRYNIENLGQILENVKTKVTVKAFNVDDKGGEKKSSSMLSMVLAYLFGFIMYMFILLYGAQVMNGVIEEKSSKVLEVVVSSVRPFQLMMGKIIGIALVGVTQFVIWVALIFVVGGALMRFAVPADVMAAASQMSSMGGMGAASPEITGALSNPKMAETLAVVLDFGYMANMVIMFLIYFMGGYLLYAAMFAAVGSAVDNVQDAQQFQLPVTIPIIVGLVGMINAMTDPHGTMAFWFSMIPFTSPIVMVARIPYGVPGWELALSIGVLVLTFVGMVWLAGKIYRVGIFMYGKKPTFAELAKWITYKS
jgi:ABC-2 type transport system permease protein